MATSLTLSIIIPVLREGEGVLALVQTLLSDMVDLAAEIIVVDGDPQGSTLAHLAPLSHPRVRGITAPPGRGSQLNAGVRQAQGELVLLLHADAQLPRGALQGICTFLGEHPDYGGGAFDLAIASPRWSLKIIGWAASLRSRLTRIPYGDQGVFLRKSLFEQIGGYPEWPLMEDIALMERVKGARAKIYIFPTPIRVSPRRWEMEGVVYCTLRNWSLVLLYYWGVSPQRLVRWYRPLPRSPQSPPPTVHGHGPGSPPVHLGNHGGRPKGNGS